MVQSISAMKSHVFFAVFYAKKIILEMLRLSKVKTFNFNQYKFYIVLVVILPSEN